MAWDRCVLVGVSLSLLAACGGGGGGPVGEGRAGGDFVLEATEPADGATIFLNDPIAFDFTQEVDLDSANLTTVSFAVLDEVGVPTTEYVTGTFQLGTKPGDAEPGRRLLFVPSYPDNEDLDNGGFRPGARYRVQLVGGKEQNGTELRAASGRGLERPVTIGFTTVEGTQPAQLFRNPRAGGPVRVGFDVSTATSLDQVPLGLMGAPPVQVRLTFDQALNPRSANLPVALDTDPMVLDEADRGRIYLEYKDPVLDDPFDAEDFTWIPAVVSIERNDLDGAAVVLEPIGVLPNNADVRCIVEATVEDIAGENNLDNASYQRVFGSFRTRSAYEQQWNAVVEDFRDLRNIDFGAVFPESVAEVGAGFLRAGFDFGGNATTLDYRPLANEVVLNTAFTQVVPENGLPFTVNGGVFRFRDVTIPQGVRVVGQGPNPMIWRCSGRFTVEGTLTVDGGDGARVDTLRAANFAKAGGVGSCGGGNGGEGSPSGTGRDQTGAAGRGGGQVAGRGGRGGLISCSLACYTNTSPTFYNGSGGGSGGGGGGMATRGDENWLNITQQQLEAIQPNSSVSAETAFQQVYGFGGSGCSGGSGTRAQFLGGGEPGDLAFSDARADNNFWGSAIDLNRRLRITGELTVPTGGGGGGGGGDTCAPDGQPWFTDFSGGGGGGGGGVLIVQALEEIRIAASGRISADGGDGGGGEQAGNCGNAGGGGGGAGGMVVLMSAKAIQIEAHGNSSNNRFLYGTPSNPQFQGRDYSFAVSADGGVGRVGGFGTGIEVAGKYPQNGQQMIAGADYDTNPSGGLGGMGVVQLMVPPGDNSDGTNTVLDDRIEFFLPGSNWQNPITGLAKQQLIAWQGFPDEENRYRDDDGNLTELGAVEGDIRPAPVLLPATIQAKSRARSKWIDTGRSQRRELGAPDGAPRGIDTGSGAVAGPVFQWAGTRTDGYVDYGPLGESNVEARYGTVVEPVPIASVDAGASYLGRPAYRVELASPVLSDEPRYVQHEAELLGAGGALLQGYGILAHDADTLWLDAARGPLPGAAVDLRVRAKFFEVRVDGTESLGSTYGAIGQPRVPIGNVRIGFAFHRDPGPGGVAQDRFPQGEGEFVYDWTDADLEAYFAAGAPRYVMWDVTFDLQFRPQGAVPPPFLTPGQELPELRFLRLPFRF